MLFVKISDLVYDCGRLGNLKAILILYIFMQCWNKAV